MNEQNGNANVNGQQVQGQQPEKKDSWFKRTGDAAYDRWVRFKTSKGGRWTIRLVKGAVIALACKTAYDEGRKAVAPKQEALPEPTQEQKTETEQPASEEKTE